jgi:hypothetical protein
VIAPVLKELKVVVIKVVVLRRASHGLLFPFGLECSAANTVRLVTSRIGRPAS